MPKGKNGASGDDFFSAPIKSSAILAAAPAEEIPVILVFSGKNSTVSTIISVLVWEM